MAPAEVVVVAERRERRSREGCAGHIPSAVAVDVTFDPLAGAEERLMRIDEKHRAPRRALRRADRPRVRPDLARAPSLFGFVSDCAAGHIEGRGSQCVTRSSFLDFRSIRFDFLDSAANFAVADARLAIYEELILSEPSEGQQVPGLEFRDEPRLDLRVLFEEIVQPIGRRLADILHLRAQLRVFGLRDLDYFKRAVGQIGVERLFAVNLRGAAQGLNVAVFDLPEIVFGLRVNETENDARIRRAVNVRRSPIVAVDGDRPGYFFETGILRGRSMQKWSLRHKSEE